MTLLRWTATTTATVAALGAVCYWATLRWIDSVTTLPSRTWAERHEAYARWLLEDEDVAA